MSEKCCGCGCDSGCCGRKQIIIDFLYLDLSVCQRCQGTESNLDAAIDEVSAVLGAAGYDIVVNKVNITSKELAIEYEFQSSPTIRIGGADIMDEVRESACCECGSLCGDSVDCRVFRYDGQEFAVPPKAMIVNAILKAVYANAPAPKKAAYELPKNLEVFFDGLDAGEKAT